MKQRQKPEIGFGECLIINVSGIAAKFDSFVFRQSGFGGGIAGKKTNIKLHLPQAKRRKLKQTN